LIERSAKVEPDNVKNAASGEISKEIGDLNLAYMLLAQKLVKQDRAAAMFRLGVSRELADMLASMSLAQILKLAASNFLLCSFRLDDHPSMSAVVGEGKDTTLQQAHMSILMSARRLQMLEAA
jgi:flagellar transcriptional activator FlhD